MWLACTTTPSGTHASTWRTVWTYGDRCGEVVIDVGAIPSAQPAVLAEAHALLAIAEALGPAMRQIRHLQVSRAPLRDYLLGNSSAAPGLDRAIAKMRTWQRRFDVQLTRTAARNKSAEVATQFCLVPGADPWSSAGPALGRPHNAAQPLPNGLRMVF